VRLWPLANTGILKALRSPAVIKWSYCNIVTGTAHFCIHGMYLLGFILLTEPWSVPSNDVSR
jgi:hypothetical protein